METDDLLGCHVSIAGGFDRAVERGTELECTAIQIFTRNQLRWHSRPIEREDIDRFKCVRSENISLREICAHGSYLPNLASPDTEVKKRSIRSLTEEFKRCGILGIRWLIVHPGNHMGHGERAGIRRIVSSLREVLEEDSEAVTILVETTAGQGTGVGYRFEHLRDIIGGAGEDRVGACLDTCHIFASGYDLRGEEEYEKTLCCWERTIGLSKLGAIHLNDSKGSLGSRIDRHQHIGKGMIGTDAFKRFMLDERFTGVPKIIETPKKMDSADMADMDVRNLELLRTLRDG